MFTINVNCICCEKGKEKIVFVTKNFWSQSDSRHNLWSHLNNFGIKYAKFGVFVNPVMMI